MQVLRSAALIILLAVLPAWAQAQILETDAEYAVILDHDTGEILWSKDGEVPMVPA